MRIEIRSLNGELPRRLRLYAERRLAFALSRFGDSIAQAHLWIGEGSHAGFDKTCRVRLRLRGDGDVVVEDVADDSHAAVDRAVDRAARAVARTLARQRERGPEPAPTVATAPPPRKPASKNPTAANAAR